MVGGVQNNCIQHFFSKKKILIFFKVISLLSICIAYISFSFIINKENLNKKEKKLCDLQVKKNFKQNECIKWSPLFCRQCYYAPEVRKDIIWENIPSDNSDYYLLPIINKKYYKEIGYKK